MPDALDLRLAQLHEDLRRRDKLQSDLDQTRAQLHVAERELGQLGKTLEKESEDVRKLEGLSLGGMLISLFGDKRERLEKERKELATAKLRYDERLETAEALNDEATAFERELEQLGDLDARRADLFAQREQMLRSAAGPAARELTELAARLADARADQRDVFEAIRAAEAARIALGEVVDALGSARSWGTFDMMGGGLIASMGKHGKLDTARNAAHRAQRHLQRLGRELGDLRARHRVEIEIGGFLKFSDFFFDNLISDWLVQSRIVDSLDKAKEALEQVRLILSDLRRRERETEQHTGDLQRRRDEIVGV